MMTQQTLKSDDLQDRWKQIMFKTCTVMRVATTMTRVVEQFCEEVVREVEVVKEVMSKAFEVFKEVCNTIWEKLKKFIPVYQKCRKVVKKSYPHSYPQIVHNYMYNTRGYTRPIMRCARSRC